MLDLQHIQDKWAKKWVTEKVFEPNVNKKKNKFFATFPYPYVNSMLHIGHLYTLMRVEALSRYKRMRGFNVLFPQAWHTTGSPIVNAAIRVKEKEPKQLKILKDVGIKDQDLPKFEDPKYWVDYFIPEAITDYKAMGMSVDWRRQFYTTELNPHYDKFIKWQFNKLKEKGYVTKGKFPVVWCNKCNGAVSDHSRSEGEGETAQEFLLFKFKLNDGRYVITATLRHDTMWGITNVYVNPDVEYVEIETHGQKWIVGEPCIEKLKNLEYDIKIIGKIQGKNLIGKKVRLELDDFNNKIPILPASFLDPHYGTGIVHSVPSDSADDLIALHDLKKNKELLEKYNLNIEDINPIEIFNTPEVGGNSAQYFLDKYEVKSQNERAKLDKIKKELYKLTFTKSTFNHLYKKGFSKSLEGMSIPDGQKIIKKELLEKGVIELFYELTGKVVCRCLTPSIVKMVSDQWFIAYGDEKWKEITHKAFDNITLYPNIVRPQFEYVIDWLHNWACTRESGLGTRLPWDEKWIIESLSDSTIYMAYYTIVHILKEIDVEQIDDKLFDYVFLGKGNLDDIKIDNEIITKMKEEFDYWYPLDFRNSGKDLVQNHLTFFVFNHCAIFPEEKWPKEIGVNGWVTVDGQKMSKSLGNMIPLRDMPEKYGVDCARFTILSGGESMDDPNWDSEFAKSLKKKLEQMYDFCLENYNKGREEYKKVDRWMESQLNEIIIKTTENMEKTLFRSALQTAYFELSNAIKWYNRRCSGNVNKDLMNKVIEAQILLLCPFTPFICEEIWEKLGKQGYASLASWPGSDKKKINEKLDFGEDMIKNTVNDINSVKRLAKVDKPKLIKLFVSSKWKYELYKVLVEEVQKTRNPGEVMKKVMANKKLRKHGKEISKFVPKLVASGKVPTGITSEQEEYDYLIEAKGFLEKEFSCNIDIIKADESELLKAKQASPGKVGVLVE